jgi:hypothetical protein
MNTVLNAEKYAFADFTFERYGELIRLAKKSHQFIHFHEFPAAYNFVLWRHDIDYSIPNALKLAQIEQMNSVKSTFYVLIHCEHYNVFDRAVMKVLHEINSMGHAIGLHFDSSYYQIETEKDLLQDLVREKKLLEEALQLEINTFSYHVPSAEMLAFDNHIYAGMVNAYSRQIKEKAKYCSDSNGYWRFDSIEETILKTQNGPIQILTHPVCWSDKIMSPRERVQECINSRAELLLKEYDEHLRKYGRLNIDS